MFYTCNQFHFISCKFIFTSDVLEDTSNTFNFNLRQLRMYLLYNAIEKKIPHCFVHIQEVSIRCPNHCAVCLLPLCALCAKLKPMHWIKWQILHFMSRL